MDEYVIAAICAMPSGLQGGDAERFFDLIIALCQSNESVSADDLVRGIGQREPGFADVAAQFRDTLRAQSLDGHWADIARVLANEAGTGATLAAMREQCGPPAAAEPGNGADWSDFRQRNQDFWTNWNGADWPTWRATFLSRVPNTLLGEVELQLSYLDTLTPAGQLTYLRDSLGFPVNQQTLGYYLNPDVSEATEDGGVVVDKQMMKAARDQMTLVAAASNSVSPHLEGSIVAAFDDVMKVIPEAATLTETEMRQLAAEIATELGNS